MNQLHSPEALHSLTPPRAARTAWPLQQVELTDLIITYRSHAGQCRSTGDLVNAYLGLSTMKELAYNNNSEGKQVI